MVAVMQICAEMKCREVLEKVFTRKHTLEWPRKERSQSSKLEKQNQELVLK